MSITPDTFAFVADLVLRGSAIQLVGKEYLVESRLISLARDAGAPDVDAYIRTVRAAPTLAAHEAIIDALTTNETSWFRDAAPFLALTNHVVPEIVNAAPFGRPLRIWSAACSSGQEPYSITMALAETFPHVPVSIVATDLSDEMLTRARAGRYSQLEVNRGLPASHLVKHFTRSGVDWQIAPAVRAAVQFQRHNLLSTPPLGGPFDVVFLRNVLIYFDLPTKRDVLSRVRQVLRPGGYLLLGAAESTLNIDDNWERVAVGRSSVYRSTRKGTPA